VRWPPTALAQVLVAATALAVAQAALACTRADGQSSPPPWRPAFTDEFDGPAGSLPSSQNWRFSIGHGYPGGPDNWGTGEIAYHTDDPANVSLDGDGNLRITPLRDAAGDWTSARIETNQQDFRPPDGGAMRIESRLALPDVTGEAALGYWPAFWALGSPYRGESFNYPGIGEFDIMENLNGVNMVWGVLHCGPETGGPCQESDGLGATTGCADAPCPGAFHTYAFEWDTIVTPNELRWYVDGQQYHQVSQADLPAETWDEMTTHAGFFIILNVAIGGAFPDIIAGTTTPVAATEPGHPMVVDHVTVSYRDAD
jgi:beta-glucanase (GH16 family)